MTLAYIGVGSNLGNRSDNIEKSRRLLINAGIVVCRVSPLYESKAICKPAITAVGSRRIDSARSRRAGGSGEKSAKPSPDSKGKTMPDFINAVFELETDLAPEDLLTQLETVERELGRKEKGNWQPRTIDLDLLLYGDEVIQTARLKVPHPEIEKRWFVVKPLVDLDPKLRHPVLNKAVRELLEMLARNSPRPPLADFPLLP